MNEIINIFNVYRDPGVYTDKGKWLKVLEQLTPTTGKSLVCGEFNAHHNLWSMNSNQIGLNLAEALFDFNLVSLNDSASITRISRPGCVSGSPDISLVSSELAHNTAWKVGEDTFGSDHLPVYIEIRGSKFISHTNRTTMSICRLNHESFYVEAEDYTNQLINTNLAAVNKYEKFVTGVQDLLCKNGARKSEGKRIQRNKAPAWWDHECSNAVMERKVAMDKYLLSKEDQDYYVYCQKDAMVKKVTRKKKRAYRKKLLREITPDKNVGEIWRMIGGLKRAKSVPKSVTDDYIEHPKLQSLVNELCENTNFCPASFVISSDNMTCLDKCISWPEYQETLKAIKKKVLQVVIISQMRF